MPLHIIREDITRMAVDAIVAAGSDSPGTPRPTGGVNGSIHRRAGKGLLQALRQRGGIIPGRATLTRAFELPCRYVIHTAGPRWNGGMQGEAQRLEACYHNALQLAAEKGFASIAFPLISSGKYGYPKAEALQVAVRTIRSFLEMVEMEVYLVVYDRESYLAGSGMFRDVQTFVDQHYVDEHYSRRNVSEALWARNELDAESQRAEQEASDELQQARDRQLSIKASSRPASVGKPPAEALDAAFPASSVSSAPSAPSADGDLPPELLRRLRQLDEGFREMLLRLIAERGMTDAECYHRANLDRKLFNKILNIAHYRPKKPTVAALCVALRLDWAQSCELLSRAGYSMSRASRFDVIVEYFITHGEYDLDRINFVLFDYDQPLLGSSERTA